MIVETYSNLVNLDPEYRAEYEAVAYSCRDLSVQLLDQCKNMEEAKTLLSERSGTAKYFRNDSLIRYATFGFTQFS